MGAWIQVTFTKRFAQYCDNVVVAQMYLTFSSFTILYQMYIFKECQYVSQWAEQEIMFQAWLHPTYNTTLQIDDLNLYTNVIMWAWLHIKFTLHFRRMYRK